MRRQVPVLLSRLGYLLRVYYDAKLSGRKHPEFKFCDVQNIDDVGIDLHKCGLTLQLMPSRLRALFRNAPEMDAFLFEEPLDIGRWRAEANRDLEMVGDAPDATDDDREVAMEAYERASEDLAAAHMTLFIGDVLVGCLLLTPVDADEARRAERALGLLVDYSCQPHYRLHNVLGDYLTEAMLPVYTTPSILLRFANAGGLPALFTDWVSDTHCYESNLLTLEICCSDAEHQALLWLGYRLPTEQRVEQSNL